MRQVGHAAMRGLRVEGTEGTYDDENKERCSGDFGLAIGQDAGWAHVRKF